LNYLFHYTTFFAKSQSQQKFIFARKTYIKSNGGQPMKNEMFIDGVRYIVTTHFDETASETVEDKMVRVAVERIKESVNGLVRQDNAHNL
jgi:hypothetical protein